jgi:voltage-gated potassium channel
MRYGEKMDNRTSGAEIWGVDRDQDDERRLAWEKATDWPLTALALIYLAAYAAPILSPRLPSVDRRTAVIITFVTWAAFAVDYLVRLVLARRRWRFVRHHILDALVVVLPLLRPLRLLRLVLVLDLLNRHITVGFRGKVVTYVVCAVALLTFVGSLTVLEAERGSARANITTYQDAVWWAVSTMATVGYGDRYPTTWEGRAIAVGLVLSGIALLGVVTASIASWFVEHVRRLEAEESRTRADLTAIAAELRELRRLLEDR